MMESSRIFVRGLPPTINEAELRKHFGTKGHVSDIKCFPQRRIGYVGFKTPEEAAAAVKYFNRSFIRMSKINVELARPIEDSSFSRTESSKTPSTGVSKSKSAQQQVSSEEQPDTNAKKRKRENLAESDPKLQEFLNVMQASKISVNKLHGHEDDAILEPSTKKIATIEEPESGDEYQSMPASKRKRNQTPPLTTDQKSHIIPQAVSVTSSAINEPTLADVPMEDPISKPSDTTQKVATSVGDDDDWLRNKTSRLLDLADEDDITPARSQPTAANISEEQERKAYKGRQTHKMMPLLKLFARLQGFSAGIYHSFKLKPRSDDVVLVKNLDANTKSADIRSLFEEHGKVLRVLIPPTGVIAIVQFASPSDGKRAFGKLAYRRFGSSQLFLEKAPRDVFFNSAPAENQEASAKPVPVDTVSASDLLGEDTKPQAPDATLFVKNLNFDTNTAALADAFQHLEGFRSALVKTKKDMKRPGQTLSMGFGFVSFENGDLANAAAKVMDGHILMGHKLQIRASHRGLDAAEERKKKDEMAKKATCTLIVKNLPFQASKREIRTLFSAYSQIKAVRMPKKFNHSGRGFAFVDFTSSKDAASALQALEGTHLLGRRLVLQYAEADAVDAEEEIAKMQKKVGGQVNKVALQELTGRGRKKFTVGGDADEGE
ncbi:hypothetical protein ONZ43_g6114 [Nemania bipapillata]|uniref:Uncharacterized protein n=1 Tax=Nemania bipapillata TaxID=110536 RepID=A0ACC2I2M5_9PEZI|nr:hypothetical protein ONZ43_g6114 [Nemania bipapillata]